MERTHGLSLSSNKSTCIRISIVTRLITAVCLAVFLCPVLSSSVSAEPNSTFVGRQQRQAIRSSLIGEWICKVGSTKIVLNLSTDGRFTLGETEGIYDIDGSTLKLRGAEAEVGYQFELAAGQLTLSGGDISQTLKFSRVPGTGDRKSWLSQLSRKSTESKLHRIAVILLVAIGCRLLLSLFRGLIRFIIYTDWGPLKYIYRYRKNRTMTMYSLVLNVSRYVIYFYALGLILTELGIDYRAYLASLSVIGLAIGFGSQGLVQDMVTGFFIIFEGQFDVGDMVEIPPHTGIVEELGIRMTRLRNYLGQKVVIPNRNIAAVGNYVKGAQQAYIDVAVADAEAATKACGILQGVGEELRRQFEGIVLGDPAVPRPMSLATGEHFVRMELSIWPQQQWVVDQQLVPRIKEMMKNSDLEIPADRVAVFYHPRQEQQVRPRSRQSKKD
jgi:small-conductance mechanosensitive channel